MRLPLPAFPAAALAVAALLIAAPSAAADPCKPALLDAEPSLWDFEADLEGDIFDGAHGANGTWRDDAFDGYGRLLVDVTGGPAGAFYSSPGNDECGREEGGREITFPAVTIEGLQVSRKVYVPAAGPGFARWLDILTNPGAATATVTVRFLGNLGTDAAPPPPTTVVFGTSSGDNTVTIADTWATTDDNGAGGDPQIVHLWDEANTGRPDGPEGITLANANENFDVQYSNVSIAPGQTAVFMHLAALRSTRGTAAEAAQLLQSGSGMVFNGMSAAEGDALRNWVGADFDRDGLANTADNCPHTANADQVDLDGDAQGDACDDDMDNDGLANADEARIGSDPRAADSDGDGKGDRDDFCATRAGLGVDGCPDTTRPTATVSRYARRPRRSRLLRHGLTARVGCDEPCSVRVQLLRSARGLGLARSGDLVVGERLFRDAIAGRRAVRVRVNRRLRRAVRRGTRLTFRVIASDPSGNRRTLNRRILVR
jgi:hypothetical protein